MSALGMGGPPQGAPASIQIGGPAPAAGGGEPDSDEGKTTEDWLGIAKDALKKAEEGEDDHIESELILKWITGIQGILAKRQSGAESALGVTPAHKAMSRAY